MDLCSLRVNNTATSFLHPRNSIPAMKPSPRCLIKKWTKSPVSPSGSLSPPTCRPFLIRATAKKSSSSGDGDPSIPEGDGLKSRNPSPGNDESDAAIPREAHIRPLDWREFRALLYIDEQDETADKAKKGNRQLPLKWAHPISTPENGCLLIASEKLDGVRTFERTVVLLLRSGTRHPQGGPFGIVMNRPLHKKMKNMNPYNLHLATTFAECSLQFGGPLEASMFLFRASENSDISGFEEVIPGISFGSRFKLEEASGLIEKGTLKPHDFRFFLGYAGWQLDQLREEIESGYWHIAACSANLLCDGSEDSSSEDMWEEILQLMGGHYSELSRKPKQDL